MATNHPCPGCLASKTTPAAVAVHTDLCPRCAGVDSRRGHYHRGCTCGECRWARGVSYFASDPRAWEEVPRILGGVA
jgi:Zn-finger nucleic acid-binding protein